VSQEKAALFRSYHREGPVLVLPNAWDVASAVVIARAGAKAIATSSAAVAWSLGKPDGEHLTQAEMLAAVARVAAAVDVPVTADVERGYGDVVSTVEQVATAGAVGVNLEDSQRAGGLLRSIEEQAGDIRAARQAAPHLVINARTDVFLRGQGGVPEAIERGKAYAEAGADSFFVPGLRDLEQLRQIVDAVGLPVNAMAVPGGPSIPEFASAGVRRVSAATIVAIAAYEAAFEAATQILTDGTIPLVGNTVGSRDLNGWLHTDR
jgi:2-methylisocitrate lyase-like PEP mutase family enzyme